MTPQAMSDLVHRILEVHHERLHRELPEIAEALASTTPRLTAPFAHLWRGLDDHMQREEVVLFPVLLDWAEGRGGTLDVAAAVASHEAEHDKLRTFEDAMRQAARDAGPLESRILDLLDDLVEHLRLEEEELHPAVLALAPALQVDAAPKEEKACPAADLSRHDHAPVAEEPPVEAGCGASSGTSGAGPHAHETVRVVRETQGVCPECHTEVPAAVVVRGGEVRLEKKCPNHGITAQLLSRNPDYWVDLDRYYFSVNDVSYPQRDYIVRMTENCNLACPICLAKANTEDTPDLDLSGLEKLLSERRGIKIDLMAAEPTLRKDLFDWIRKVKTAGSIAALHTNGLKLADADYCRELKEAGVDEVFLQFDGMDEKANKALRGRPLLKARMQTLKNLKDNDIATSLIVVIAKNLNEPQVSETFKLALRPEGDHIREVFFLGLRLLGSAKHAGTFADQQLMPDELIDMLCEQEPRIRRTDVKAFNMFYFSMLSAFHVKKCLYVQHYLVMRDGNGGYVSAAEMMDLDSLGRAAQRYASRRKDHPALARLRLGLSIAGEGLKPKARQYAFDLLQLERLFQRGMNLGEVPRKMLILGFITACDEHNFDSQVAINCGKGEISSDGGLNESGAVANVRREARFSAAAKEPGRPLAKQH